MVGHTFEYNGAVLAIRDYIRQGLLGELYYIAMRRLNLGIVRSDGNAMWSLAPHDISILCTWLEREPVSVNASGMAHLQSGIEDVVFLTIHFDGGVVGHIQSSWLDPNKVREATVVGSKKMLVYDDVSPEAKLRLYDKGIVRQAKPASLDQARGLCEFPNDRSRGGHSDPEDQLSRAAGGAGRALWAVHSGRQRAADGSRSGRRVVAVLEAAQRSLRNRGELEAVHLERPPTEVAGMKQYSLVDLAAIQEELGDELEAAVLEVIRRLIGSSAGIRSRSSSARSPTTWARPTQSASPTAPMRSSSR